MKNEVDNFILTEAKAEILFNIERYKTRNDSNNTKQKYKKDKSKYDLKQQWIEKWEACIATGFKQTFGDDSANFKLLSLEDLYTEIEENKPEEPWFYLVLMEAMLFEPYYPLEWNIKGEIEDTVSSEYGEIEDSFCAYSKKGEDCYLETNFAEKYNCEEKLKEIKKFYNQCLSKLISSTNMLDDYFSNTEMIKKASRYIPHDLELHDLINDPQEYEVVTPIYSTLAYLGSGVITIWEPFEKKKVVIGGGPAIEAFLGSNIDDMLKYKGQIISQYLIIESSKLIVSKKVIFGDKESEYFNNIYNEYGKKIEELEDELDHMKEGTGKPDEQENRLQKEIISIENIVKIMKNVRGIW